MTAPRVTLGAFRDSDVPMMVRSLSDLDTARWLSSLPWPFGDEDARAFIAGHGPNEYAIRVDGAFAGTIRGGDLLGYWVAPEYRRRGVARRAAVLALSRSFATGHEQVAAEVDPANAPSLHMLKALGFCVPQPSQIFFRRLGAYKPGIKLTLSRAGFVARHGVSITTPRLLLDQVRAEDLPALYDIATRPEVARMLLRFSPDMDRQDFAANFSTKAAIPPFRLAIRYQDRVIGSIGIGAPDQPDGASIFYFLSPEAWGQGLGGEALTAFLDEIDARFDPPKLHAGVFADNPASDRLLQRVGFRRIRLEQVVSLGRDSPAPGWSMRRDRA